MKNPLRILLLEDCHDDATLIEWQLRKGGITFTSLVVNTKATFENALTEFAPDVILADHSLPDFNSIEAFELFKNYQSATGVLIPFILVTGNVSEEFAVQAIKGGIDDYVLKDRLKRLPLAVESALEKCKIDNERLTYLGQVIAKEALMNEAEQLGNFGSWEVDLSSGKVTWSDATFSIYGFKPGEVEPDYAMFLTLVHPDDLVLLKGKLLDILEKKNEAEIEFRIIDRAGAIKYLISKMSIHRRPDGQPLRIVGFHLDISERRKAARALRISEQEFRSLSEENPDVVFSLDLPGRLTNVNQAFINMVEYSREEMLGIDFRKILVKSKLENAYEHFVSVLDRRPQRYETTFVNKSGKTFRLDVTLMAVVVDQKIIGAHCIAKDVTEKKKFQNLLDEAYMTARIGSWELELGSNQLSWGGITAELHEAPEGYQPTIARGLKFYKAGRSREIISAAIRGCIDNGVPWDLELQIITCKGNERWVRTIGQGVIENGKCVRLYGTFQDIHDRTIAENALRKVFEEKVNILESIGDGFFAINTNGTVTYWNKMAESILRLPRHEILGNNLWEVFKDDASREFYSLYQKAMVEKVPVHFEEYHSSLEIWVDVNIYPSAAGLSVYFKDITKQKKHMLKIERQNRQLSEIARIQSHELRAPLARLLGLVHLLDEGMERDSELPSLLENIRSSAQELDGVVRDVVRMSEKRSV